MKIPDARIVLFESDLRENFYPLSLMRPTFDFLLGTTTQLRRIETSIGSKVTDVIVPKYLEATTREAHPELRVNDRVEEKCIVISSLVSPDFSLRKEIENASKESPIGITFEAESELPVFALLERLDARLIAGIDLKDTDSRKGPARIVRNSLLKYPWQIYQQNSNAITLDFNRSKNATSRNRKQRFQVIGNRLVLKGNPEIDRYVTFDTRGGPVIVDEGAEVQSFSHITGPSYIGKKTIVKSARIREGTSIGNVCKVSGELEEAVVFDYSNKNHEGFLSHAVVGSWVNLGAMTTNSDLKNTYGKIRMDVGGKKVDSGLNKIGVFVGDMAKTAIGAMIYSGKKIGVSSHLYGTVIEDVPSFTLYAKSLGVESKELYVESALETQRRMMERRRVPLTPSFAELVKYLHRYTTGERSSADVRTGKFEFA